jgi:DNA-binding transcriptional LysR family regulator
MRLRHIEIFDAVSRTGSLTEAARILHISQPAASKLLANAEAQLGFKLFDRVKGRLRATREADVLAPQVARLRQELQGVERLAHNLKHSQNGVLRIGSTPALGLGMLPAVVAKMRQTQPGVLYDLRTYHSAELIQGLLARELDLAVLFDPASSPGLACRQIGHTELVHMGPCRTNTGPLSLEQVAVSACIALEANDPAGALLQQALQERELRMTIVAQVQTHYVACALVAAGCGDTVVDLITARAMLRPGLMLSRLKPTIQVPISVMTHATEPLSEVHHGILSALEAQCHALRWPDEQDNLRIPM